jgi:hypothetical protein
MQATIASHLDTAGDKPLGGAKPLNSGMELQKRPP